MLPQRRQNSSCDPCRRSKRRCFFSSPRIGDTDVVCTHCERLGHTCTFEFVGSQLQKKRPRRARTRQNTSDSAAEVSSGLASGDFQADAVAGHGVLASWLDFDYLEQNNECLELPDLFAPDAATEIETSEDRLRMRPNLQHLVGSSLNSPIRLLNSKLDATVIDIRLARIYDTIVTGCASRFVDYGCNLYATASRYRLGDGDSEHHLLSSNASPQSQVLTSQTDISFDPGLAPRDPGCMMTVLGTVRFLDHFSDLYGNRLTTVARRQSDAALKAVLRLFSLQWLPTAEPTSTSTNDSFANNPNGNQRACGPLENVFHDAWFQARTLLRNAQSVRSFRVVYAILFFDGITVPAKAHGAVESIVAHEFLDAGLQKLISLDTLVNQYCATLGSHSVYGALLEASLSVVRWGGYIRDIGAALTTTGHHCKLPGISSHAKDQVESYDPFQLLNWDLHPDLINSVSSICQKAVAEAFCVWRQIVEFKDPVSRHVQSHSHIPLESSEILASTMTAVGKFNQSFRPFMSTCIDNLGRLSIRSRTSAVSITLYWDLSILILAESLRDHNFLTSPHITSTMRVHQEEAVSSVAQIVERVLSLPTEELFNLENGLSAEVPILAYHITPSLTATSFQKAIENIISLQECKEDAQHDTDRIWKQQIDIVMKGLCSLDVTVGGSQVASAAIQLLMQQHGDILSECWTSDFST